MVQSGCPGYNQDFLRVGAEISFLMFFFRRRSMQQYAILKYGSISQTFFTLRFFFS